MIHDIANYIEIKKNIKQLDRVYFTLAIEECLKFKDWNLEGFLIDKHKHSLKNIMYAKPVTPRQSGQSAFNINSYIRQKVQLLINYS